MPAFPWQPEPRSGLTASELHATKCGTTEYFFASMNYTEKKGKYRVLLPEDVWTLAPFPSLNQTCISFEKLPN